MLKVTKFGGSSLADAAQFKKVRAIMQADPQRLFIVPSAPGKRTYKDEKVTDMLYQCQKLASEGSSFEEVFDRIAQRYIDIAQELELTIDIRSHLQIVWNNLMQGASAEYAASRGEYLNGKILAHYLGFDFIDAAKVIYGERK